MGSILRPREGLRDPALAWAVIPSRRLSGDVVAAGRTPRWRLLAMLADATGHGLPAAISLLPVLIEAASPQGEPFGAARLRAHLCESRRKPGGQLDFQGVLDAVAAHRAGAPAHDDISLMAIALDACAARHG